jgi:hypothetical protein
VRSALVTLLVAAAVGAAALGTGWTVQAASLPAPERGALVVARASTWLSRYRLVDSEFAVGGRPPVHAQCLEGWFPPGRTAGARRGTMLHFGRHGTVAALEGRKLAVLGMARPEAPQLALAQLELGGCSRLLSHAIETDLQSLRRIRVERATVADRPALRFVVPLKLGRIVMYVTPRTYRPIALSLTLGALHGRSLLRLTRATPALLATFAERP